MAAHRAATRGRDLFSSLAGLPSPGLKRVVADLTWLWKTRAVNPADAECLAQTHLAHSLPRRWAHVRAVAAAADSIAAVVGADGDLLRSAAWLHDIGYAPDLVETGFHPLDGARFLRSKGAPDRLCRLVAHHSAAVLEAELRGCADALVAEFAAESSALADALWWCDQTTGPDGQRFGFAERVAEIEARYGPDHVVTSFVRRARPVLGAAVQRTEDRLVTAGIAQPM